MISRERVRLAINHKEADRIPLDLGSTLVMGIQASIYAKLKNALGISKGLVRLYDSLYYYIFINKLEKEGINFIL